MIKARATSGLLGKAVRAIANAMGEFLASVVRFKLTESS